MTRRASGLIRAMALVLFGLADVLEALRLLGRLAVQIRAPQTRFPNPLEAARVAAVEVRGAVGRDALAVGVEHWWLALSLGYVRFRTRTRVSTLKKVKHKKPT